MIVLMALPIVISCLLAASGRHLGRVLPPATAVRLLSAAAVLTALSTGCVLGVAGFLVIAQAPAVAAMGRWSVTSLADHQPTQLLAGGACAALVVLLLGSAVRRLLVAGGDLARSAAACRRLGHGAYGLVIIEDDEPDAYALPGVTGRVVISTAMLRALDPDERRVLLAHEAAHLRHRHHLYALLADLGAAANPLLRPLAVAVRDAIERWADEDAADEVADRRLAARAIARAGLARSAVTSSRSLGGPALGAADTRVSDRTRALLAPRLRPRRVLAAGICALVLCGGVAAAATASATEHRFEVARQVYGHTALVRTQGAETFVGLGRI
ncbi:MAG: M48 family metalloprotease [Knoellia sp.]